MEPTEDYIVALNAIEIDPNMTGSQLKQVIERQVRELIVKYQTGQLHLHENKHIAQ